MALSWLTQAYMTLRPLFCRRVIVTQKVDQIDLVLVYDQGSLVGLYVQNYKYQHAVVTICDTLINTQTDVHTHGQEF